MSYFTSYLIGSLHYSAYPQNITLYTVLHDLSKLPCIPSVYCSAYSILRYTVPSQFDSLFYYTLYFHAVITCPPLTDPTNGQVTVTSRVFGSIATYDCDSGFILVGETSRTCLETGQWSGAEPQCEGKASY